jgi:hypothetical protein
VIRGLRRHAASGLVSPRASSDQCQPDAVPPVVNTALRLWRYCEGNDWAGYDPYDALNSPIFSLPILDRRVPRLVATQLLKRAPFNLRPLLGVRPSRNPKTLALAVTACINLARLGLLQGWEQKTRALVEGIRELRSPDSRYWCWGYSFPWQTRRLLVPRGAANLVCTVFVANALLDAYEALDDVGCLEMASSAASYLVEQLYWEEADAAGFRYPLPSSTVRVHNANLLAAALLARVYSCSRESRFLAPAMNAARYSVRRQRLDGSWSYGEDRGQQWIDNFHTGYNLCALRAFSDHLATDQFDDSVSRGFDFYLTHFFRSDGAPRYYSDRTYPIDAHCVAQSILTMLTFSDLAADSEHVARKVFRWAMTNLWDERRGYFYYRDVCFARIRVSYIRWSQAWMLLALTTLLGEGSRSIAGCAVGVRR